MKEKYTKTTDLLALMVFAIFAVCVLLVLLYGANAYRNLVRSSGERFETRTASQYVTTRIHQAKSVTVADFDGCDALVIPEEIDGMGYVTRIYCHDGYLRELFSTQHAALSPEDGEKILPAQRFCAAVEDGLLTVTIDGREVKLYLHAGGEAAP